jgi:putative endonuclease
VFCEVKTRRAGSGSPWDRARSRQALAGSPDVEAYLSDVEDRPWSAELRFDAVGVTIDAQGRLATLEHLRGAF